jgi:hypothetical protein
MKITFLNEPELEFGGGGKHVDIKFGLMQYGPLDYASSLMHKNINVGIVGTSETIDGVQTWLEHCRNEIPAKKSRQPRLFPKFPGFRADTCFHATLSLDSRLHRPIGRRMFENLRKHSNMNHVVSEAMDLFLAELRYLAENTLADVLLCAVPAVLLNVVQEISEEARTTPGTLALTRTPRLDFHDLLKAKTMGLQRPLQLILPPTYDEMQRKKQKRRPERFKQLQDEATRAWNIHTALYYKAGGIPWRIVRDPAALATCYVGISFYESLDRSRLLTSIAQVFNERGEGVVVRGGTAKIAKDDRQPHIQADDAYKLLQDALNRYREVHHNFPARVVLHKSSRYSADERDGFAQAARDLHVDLLDFISIGDSFTRLFRIGAYPPLRGTFLSLDASSHVLYTRGSVNFFATYPGMFIPLPLAVRCEETEQPPKFLAQEILALTKMNWNNTQFDGAEPITLRAAHRVGGILKYVGDTDPIASHYRFYM